MYEEILSIHDTAGTLHYNISFYAILHKDSAAKTEPSSSEDYNYMDFFT
jgi:hypothetical protein